MRASVISNPFPSPEERKWLINFIIITVIIVSYLLESILGTPDAGRVSLT